MTGDLKVGYLEELVGELDACGLIARVVRTRSGPAFLRVVNPRAASLTENVTCAPAPESREHYFWWSWGERLHRVDDPGAAARKVARVLEPLTPTSREGSARA
ncbi:hypothetical protein [Actinocorallia longicatena]|uniref:Uncharacterized protein n=1 Tax=Actinocorallia longicatena TaxID=111803 RepID=A0ABP6QI57_9ACTN